MTTTSWNQRVLPLLRLHNRAYRSLTRLLDRIESELSSAAERASGLKSGNVCKVLKPISAVEGGLDLPVDSVLRIVGIEFLSVDQVKRKRPKLVVRFVPEPLIKASPSPDEPVYALYGNPLELAKHLQRLHS